jgi:hypothetical protein
MHVCSNSKFYQVSLTSSIGYAGLTVGHGSTLTKSPSFLSSQLRNPLLETDGSLAFPVHIITPSSSHTSLQLGIRRNSLGITYPSVPRSHSVLKKEGLLEKSYETRFK